MSSIPRAIQDIKGCIQALTNEQENGPITDNCTELQKFCAKLEYVLQIDMKVRVGMLGGKKDYWDFFCSCLGKVKGLNDGIRFVKNMKEVKTSLGRGRAFIRYSLVHHRLGDTLQQCVSSEEITRQWYNESSILRQPGAFSAVVNDFYDLNDIQFDLTPSGQELDTAWPTFARSAIGVGLYLWNPPTRSSSMASINSQPSQADSRGMESMTEVDSAILDNQLERLQGELAECEKYNRDLRHQLQASQTELEECKSLAVENEARMSSELEESQRRNQELVYRSDQAVAEMETAQREREKALQEVDSMSREHQRITNELGERVETLKLQLTSESTMRQKHEDEQRGESLDHQKRIGELEVKLKGSEMEMQHLREVEARLRTSLRDAETKNQSLEERAERLTATMDGNLTSRADQLSQEFQSVSLLRSLFIRLSTVQSEDKELNNMKTEFYSKLENLLGVDPAGERENSEPDVNKLEGALSRLEEGISASQQEIKEVKVGLEEAQGSKVTPVERRDAVGEVIALEEHRRQVNNLTKELEEWKLTAEQRRNLVLDRDLRLKEKTNQVNQAASETKARKDSVVAILESCDQMLQNMPELSSESDLPKYYLPHNRKGSPPIADVLKSLPGFLRALEGKFSDLQYEKENLKEKTERQAEEMGDLQKRLEDEILARESLNKETDTFQHKMDEVVSSQTERDERIEKLEAELTEARAEIVKKETEANQIKVSDDQLKNDLLLQVEKFKRLAEEVEEKSKEVKVRCNALEEENSVLKTAEAEAKDERESLISQNSILEERILRLEEELVAESAKVTVLEKSVDDKNVASDQEKASIEQTHERTITEVIQEHENKVEFMTEQFKLLKNELETVTFEKEELIRNSETLRKESLEVQTGADTAERERTELEEKYDKLMKDHRIIQGNCDAITSQNETLKSEYESLLDISEKDKELLSEREETIASLDAALDCARETSVDYSQKIEKQKEQLAEKQEEIELLQERLKSSQEECQNSKMVMEREVSAIEFQRSSEAMQYQEKLESFEELTSELSHWKERCEELEENLATKTNDFSDIKASKEIIEEENKNKLKLKEAICMKQKDEIQVLETSLLQISNQLEQRAKNVIELEDMVKSTQKYDASQIDQLRAKLEQKEKDNEELMKQIVKFGKEKDVMWQRLQKVENHRKLKAMERWIEDKDVKQCMECECQFSLTVRKHHCRMCGGVFCSKCTECSILTSQSKKKVRVCDKCFVLHNHSLESEGMDTSAIINDSMEEEHLPTFSDSRLSISSSSSLTDPPTTSASAVGSDADQNAGREDSSQDNEEAERQETAGEEGATDQGGNENQGEAAEVKNKTEAADGSSSGRDGDFDIITDEDVTEIRQEEDEEEKKEEEEASETKPEYSQFDSVTSNEIQSAENQQKEVYLVAGTSHMVPVVMDAEGVLLCWEFTSSPKSIAFKVSYAESVGDELLEEIVPLQRFNSHQQSASGELLTYKKGVYVLQFDNTFSRLTPKTVVYQLSIKEPDICY